MGEAGSTCMSIVLASELPDGLPQPSADSAIPPPIAWLARRCLRELHAHDSAAELALEAAALELIAKLARCVVPGGRRSPEWLDRVRDYLHAHALDRVRLADLAAVAGVHEVHVVRAFRTHVGVTPGTYVRELRVEHARRALANTDTPLAEIALEAGFSSQAHFTRVFHRLAGITPGAFRRALGPRNHAS
jgi:AraC family transcriptional regulator